jgi:hypothetical protein
MGLGRIPGFAKRVNRQTADKRVLVKGEMGMPVLDDGNETLPVTSHRWLLQEARRILLDLVDVLERHLSIEPRTSELRRIGKRVVEKAAHSQKTLTAR